MPPAADPTKSLVRLFRRQKVVELSDLFAALGTHSRMTVFRRMVALGYLSSYSHAGRYYTLPDIPRFDEHGLWQHAGALFSRDGTLKETIVRLVEGAVAGEFQRDLQVRLQLRVHNTLADLTGSKRLARKPVHGEYLYVSASAVRGKAQLAQRLSMSEVAEAGASIAPAIVIEVLLEIIHGSVVVVDAKKISTRLAARGIAITPGQVVQIIDQHGVVKKTVRSP